MCLCWGLRSLGLTLNIRGSGLVGGGGGGGWRFLPCMAGWNCLRAWARFFAACMALNGRSLGPGGSS